MHTYAFIYKCIKSIYSYNLSKEKRKKKKIARKNLITSIIS